ncbi:MAG: cell division protein ZapE [Luteimonas sp.]
MAEADAAALPSARYRQGVERGDWDADPAQAGALRELDRLHVALVQAPARKGLLGKLLGAAPDEGIQGLYLWGGVGRGKTFLIDLFHDGLPLQEAVAAGRTTPPLPHGGRGRDRSQRGRWAEVNAPDVAPKERTGVLSPARGGRWPEGQDGGRGKRRTHFHRFMREIHQQLRAHAGERDPLAAIAREWRKSLRILVLDEFFVEDIGDAMLLGRLLKHLFAEGVVLVTSSNAAPSALYRDGLQRARFLPAIALIERHCAVVHLDSATDYRLRALTRSPVYRAPLDDGSDAWLEARWHALGGDDAHRNAGIEVEGRRLTVRARTAGMAWFDFAALCDGPRSAADYIEIAREFHTLLLGDVPVLDAHADDAARRFVTLVDELYDRHVNLVCTTAAPPQDLYAGERLAAAFERTASRLVEMQSADYLALEHRG